MASTVTGRAWRRSSAEGIEADLAALWQEVARGGPVSRAVMSNLVVFCRCPSDRDVDLASPPEGIPVDEVASHHPARVILLHHDPEACDPHAALAAHVGVLLFGPPGARYGIEQIVIRSACPEDALPSIVRRFTLGGVPTSIWWTEDFSGTGPLTPLVTMGRQLLYDSRRWGDVGRAVLALAPLLADELTPDLADINWRRLTRLQQALLHALRSAALGDGTATPVQIRYRRGEAALAWLLAGWLLSAGSEGSVAEDPRLTDDILTVSFSNKLQVRLGGSRVTVADALGPAPFAISVQDENEAEAVAAELHTLTHDACLHRALSALVQRFSAA